MDIFRSIKDAAARRSLIEGVIGGNSEWFDRRRIRLEARLGVDRFTQFDGVVGAPSPVKEKPLFDVSGLESWASCPFRFFIERTLGLEEAEEPEIAFSPPASVAGTALHKGLEELYRRAAIERKFPLAREREWAASVIESAFARRRKRLREDWLAPDFAYAAAEGQWKQRILGALDDLDRLDSGYGDSGSKRLEWKFELALPEVDGASIRGKIDRLDFAPTGGIRVVDYKTGKVSSPDEFESGSRLQLPIYLTAALRETGAPEGESSASYFQIGPGGGIRVLSLGGGWLSANRDELFRFVKVITAGISGGFFPPLPLHDPSCSNCPAAKACDLPGRAAARRKLSDPAGEGLRSLREEE